MLAGFKADGEDSDALFDLYIKLYNDCLAERPSDMHVGVHLCRGNFVGGRHFLRGWVRRHRHQALPQPQRRHVLPGIRHSVWRFEPLKELPKGKSVILGLITSKFPKLEDIGEMKKKVEQAAKLISEGTGESYEEALDS